MWLVNVGRSSANKTAPTKAIMKPIIEAQQAGYNAFSEAYSQWERDNVGKKKDERNEADKPKWNTQLYISKGSAEGRYKAMQDNPNGVLMWADELATFFGNLGRYNNGDDATELLNFFDGTSSPINIKSEIPKMLENPFMSIFGGIQPGILGKIFGSDSFLNNGLNQRVLFAYPDSYPSADYFKRKRIGGEIKEFWHQTVLSLLDDAGSTLYLDLDAEKLYGEFCNECQKKAEAAEDDYEASLYGKFRPNVLRWAAVAHYLSDNRGMTRVTPTVMEYAIRCMRYFATAGARVYEHLKHGCLPKVKPMGNQELIAELAKRYKISSQADLAKVLGISQKNVSTAINKFK